MEETDVLKINGDDDDDDDDDDDLRQKSHSNNE